MFKSVDEIPADLRWLAENVHEWPKNGFEDIADGVYRVWVGAGTTSEPTHITMNSSIIDDSGDFFTRAQWQAARDLISGKPGWDEAPEGARIRVQHPDGHWRFCTYKYAQVYLDVGWVGVDEGEWFPPSGGGEVLGDWRDTLEHKPADEPTPEEDDHFAGPTSSEDIGNALLDGDAPHTKVDPCASPVTFADLDQPLVSTVARELRVTHSDGHIDVEYLFEGGVMLTDDQGGETQIPDEETLTAVYHAALRVLRGES